MVKSINFVVLGKQDIAADFGKKGTVTDISLYDRKESDIIKTWVTPNGFPEKIQPLLQGHPPLALVYRSHNITSQKTHL